MRKLILKATLVVALAAVAGYGVYTSQRSQTELSDTALASVEALASSEKGCVSRTGANNGDCTTDGSRYFCENSTIFHDCVKGEYY